MKTGMVIVHYNDYESISKLINNIKDYNVLDKILIVDNMKQNFKYQKDNGILIKSFYGEEEGKGEHVLEDLANILIKIAQDGGDIRNGLIKYKNEIINKVTLGT